MAFQNSAGGIIIDAVLTDVGRKYLAQGKFKVSKFALGDDEINYSFGELNGEYDIATSALPPVLEAFSNENANINYGLLSLTSEDILYIPQLKVNEKAPQSVNVYNDDFYYVAVNKETARKMKSDIGAQHVLQQNEFDKNKLFIESGIDIPGDRKVSGITVEYKTDLRPTMVNKKAYILNNNLYDRFYSVYTDGRFVDSLLHTGTDSMYENDNDNNLYSNFSVLKTGTQISLPEIVDYYEAYRVEAVDQAVVRTTGGNDGNDHSAFEGPRGTIFALNIKVNKLLTGDSQTTRDFRYTKFGLIDQPVFGGNNRYDFINTTIYIQGLSSNSRLSVPVRLIRFSGTS